MQNEQVMYKHARAGKGEDVMSGDAQEGSRGV